MGTRHEQKPTAEFYLECTSTYLLTILLRDKVPQTFRQKPKKEKTRARKPLIFLRAGLTERLREAGPVTSPPLGGDSLGFGLATLGVSVSLARCQRGSGFEWRLCRSRDLRRARLSTAVWLLSKASPPSYCSSDLDPPTTRPLPPTPRRHSTSSNSPAFSVSQRGFLSGLGRLPSLPGARGKILGREIGMCLHLFEGPTPTVKSVSFFGWLSGSVVLVCRGGSFWCLSRRRRVVEMTWL